MQAAGGDKTSMELPRARPSMLQYQPATVTGVLKGETNHLLLDLGLFSRSDFMYGIINNIQNLSR